MTTHHSTASDPADLAEQLRSMRVRTIHDRIVADPAADQLDRSHAKPTAADQTLAGEVYARINGLAITMPSVDARIIGRLLERCPEIVAGILDDIEAGR